MRSAGDEMHIGAALQEARAKIAADAARPHDGNSHRAHSGACVSGSGERLTVVYLRSDCILEVQTAMPILELTARMTIG
jgi:hypothetical protein